MNELDELIYDTERLAKLFDGYLGATVQTVMGKERRVCSMCGDCPSALLEGLKRVRGMLESKDSRSRKGSDAMLTKEGQDK